MANITPRRPLLRRLIANRATYFAVTAVLLAIVLFVSGALVRHRGVPTLSDSESRLVQSDDTYREGLTAYESGETTRGIELISRSAAGGNEDAKKKLESIRKESPSRATDQDPPFAGAASPDTAPPDGTPANDPSDEGWTQKVPDVSDLLPLSFPGYNAGTRESTLISAEVPLDPISAAKIRRAVVFVIDKGSPAGADGFVDGSRRAFDKDLSTLKVGPVTALFGTDGAGVADLSFARGRFAFDVTVTGIGAGAAELKDAALAIAAKIPAAQ